MRFRFRGLILKDSLVSICFRLLRWVVQPSTVVLKIECTLELLGKLGKTKMLGPYPQLLTQYVCVEPKNLHY